MARKQAMMQLMDAMLVAGAVIPDVRGFCVENGISRRTFERHRARIAVEGEWRPRSRRPRSSPQATPEPVVAEVLRLREELAPDHGADPIRAELLEIAEREGWPGLGWPVPSRATINRILDRAGVVAKNPKKRPRSSWRRFSYARPRDCYQLDGTEHTLADGTVVVAIDVIDDCSRVWTASVVGPVENTELAIAAIQAASSQFGPPGLVLADCGSAFTGGPLRPGQARLPGRFTRHITDTLGARLIHSSPYHPQTCGKCERLHQTAGRLLRHHYPEPAASITELQHRLDTIRDHYNTRRRHSAVGTTPLKAFTTAPAHGGPGDLPRQTDATIHTLKVTTQGRISIGHTYTLILGTTHAATTVTVLINGPHATIIAADGEPLGSLTLNPHKRHQGRITPAA